MLFSDAAKTDIFVGEGLDPPTMQRFLNCIFFMNTFCFRKTTNISKCFRFFGRVKTLPYGIRILNS